MSDLRGKLDRVADALDVLVDLAQHRHGLSSADYAALEEATALRDVPQLGDWARETGTDAMEKLLHEARTETARLRRAERTLRSVVEDGDSTLFPPVVLGVLRHAHGESREQLAFWRAHLQNLLAIQRKAARRAEGGRG